MRIPAPLLAFTAALGVYPFIEKWLYRVNHVALAGARRASGGTASVPPVAILHVSDMHMKASDTRLMRFLERVPDALEHEPDVVVATGDLIDDDSGIEPAVATLGALFPDAPRFYVLGSHDYFQSRFKSYLKYFTSRGRGAVHAPHADVARLEAGLKGAGWVAVTNSSTTVEAPFGRLLVSGVDDPYLDRHHTGHISREAGVDLALGLVHAPDVVSEWALAGFDLVLAGHAHAGQVRVPGIGALVTNCSLPNALAGGATRIGDAWLHVSPGLGTGRFGPIRFNCRPEVTLLTLG